MRRELRHDFKFGLFHDDDARLRVRIVNSVSLQPISVQTGVSGQAGQTAGTGIVYRFPVLEPFELLPVYAEPVHFTHNEYGTRILLGRNAMTNGDTRGERLQIMLTGEELIILDNFRYSARMPSRAAAVRELLRRGLAAEGFEAAAFGAKSEEFGVSGKMPPGRKTR